MPNPKSKPKPTSEQFLQEFPEDPPLSRVQSNSVPSNTNGRNVFSETARGNAQRETSQKQKNQQPKTEEVGFDAERLAEAEAYLEQSHSASKEEISSTSTTQFLKNLNYVLGAREYQAWWLELLRIEPNNPHAIANQAKNVRGAMFFQKGGRGAKQAWTQQTITLVALIVTIALLLVLALGLGIVIVSNFPSSGKIERTQ